MRYPPTSAQTDIRITTPVFAALAVGDGASTALAAASVMPGGTLVAIANDAQNDRTLENGDYRFICFGLDGHAGDDMAELLALVVAGQFTAQVGWRGDWSRIQEAMEALFARRVDGKAIIDI